MTPNITTPEQQLFDLFSAGITDQAICLVADNGIIRSWNNGARNFYQYDADAIIGKHVSTLLAGTDALPYLAQAIAAGSSDFEADIRRKDGSCFPGYLTFQPVYQQASLSGCAFTARSLAYTRKMEYRFVKSAGKKQHPGFFQHLIEHSYSGVTLFDAELNFIYRSPSAARITGFNDKGRSDVTFIDIVHPADKARISALLDDLKQKPGSSVTCSLRSRHHDGYFIHLEGVFTNWLQQPEIGAIVLNFHDVSERHQSEDRLKQTITELSAYKQALDAGAIVAITDRYGIIRYVNDNFCKISGYSEQELLGQDHRIVNSGYHDKAFMAKMWRTIGSGEIWEGELRNRKKDGSFYWVATTIVPFLNELGVPHQYLAIRFDRTEAKAFKQELIKKNAQIGSLLESINDGFIGLDHELRYTYVNRRTCQMVGMKAEDMIGRKMWDLFPDAVGSVTWRAVQQALATGQPVTNEDYYAPLNLWQENHIYPNDNGLSIFISDITWRKRAEEQKALLADIGFIFNRQASLLQMMEEVMQQLAKFSSSVCLAETWLIGRDGKQLLLSAQTANSEAVAGFFKRAPEFKQLNTGEGLPGATWLSDSVLFWTSLDSHPEFLRREAAKAAGLRSAFGIPLRHNQKVIGVLLLGLPHDEWPERLDNSFLSDLGDYLGAAISRRQLETDLQAIFDAAPDIICIVGTDRYFKKVNPAMCSLLGYTEAELLNKPIDALVHPDDLANSMERMRRFVSGELTIAYFENRYRASNGADIYLAWTVSRGKEEGVLFCVARNISAQKTLEKEAENFLQERNAILESIGDAFFSVNRNWVVQYWNHTAEMVLGVPKEHVLGQHLWTVFSMAVGSPAYEQLYKAFDSGQVCRFENYSSPICKWFDISIYPSTNGLSVFFKDITERKKTEEALKAQTDALAASHQQYTDLFQLSPLPKFVFDVETLAFLDVNLAAVRHYGYSHQEFQGMTLRDIRPESELHLLENAVGNANKRPFFYQPGTFVHRKKNGELIMVEIISSALDYGGRPARIALAMDVTERQNHLEAIEKQNQKLREISWMQSHVIRAPLSRIMGLIQLMDYSVEKSGENAEILHFIELSAYEMDRVIRAITDDTLGDEPA